MLMKQDTKLLEVITLLAKVANELVIIVPDQIEIIDFKPQYFLGIPSGYRNENIRQYAVACSTVGKNLCIEVIDLWGHDFAIAKVMSNKIYCKFIYYLLNYLFPRIGMTCFQMACISQPKETIFYLKC